jgi:hypothetical protein
VRADEVTYSQVVELITSGRSGSLGLDVARPNGNGHAKTKGGLTSAETIGQHAAGAQGVQNAEITEKGFDAS